LPPSRGKGEIGKARHFPKKKRGKKGGVLTLRPLKWKEGGTIPSQKEEHESLCERKGKKRKGSQGTAQGKKKKRRLLILLKGKKKKKKHRNRGYRERGGGGKGACPLCTFAPIQKEK